MQELPDKSMFSESLNSEFLLEAGGSELVALELTDLRNGHADPRSESFALHFRGPGTFVLPQQIYKLKHAVLGEFDLFLVPIGRDANGTYYEAVINRLLPSF